MTVQYFIVGIFAILTACGTVVGQTPQRPVAPVLPPLPPTLPALLPPSQPALSQRLASPQRTELPPPQQVRTSSASRPDNRLSSQTLPNQTLPNQGELVSILKQRLPTQNQTIEVKDAPEWFQTMMQRIVRENVPQKYVQDKDWGKTEKRWDGVKVKRKGVMNWHTKRQWKEVNHGTWKRYEVTQIDPNENLKMRIENVRDAGAGKVGFEVALAAKMHVFGRMANWAKGIQVYNISADANASVEMRVWCQVGMRLDVRKFPPDVIMMPEVTQADLTITDFRLQRVSKLKGPLVKQLSGSVHKILLDKIQEKRAGLPKKINREIAKNQDQMRLSLADFASSKWNALTKGETEETKPEQQVASQDVESDTAAQTISDMRDDPEVNIELPALNAPIANPAPVQQPNQSTMRSILVRPKLQASQLTMPVGIQSGAEPELLPTEDPVAERMTEDAEPAVDLVDFVPPSERVANR